jgi:hypothetical protein
MSKKTRVLLLLFTAFLMIACGTTVTPTAGGVAPGSNETQVAMQVQLTVQAGQQATMAAQLTQQPGQIVVQPTAQSQPPAQPQIQPTSQPVPTSTQDVSQQIANAKILIYEDTMFSGGLWIRDALNNMGLNYTHVYDAVGDFMSNLNSGIAWDLIIVGAESKGTVQGEFWDVIGTHINGPNKTALIAEIWYLDLVGEGRIKPVLTKCGITYMRDWPLADSIYWLAPTNPILNQPNTVLPFLHYNRYWANEAGDLIKLTPGSNASLLAGTMAQEKTSYGVLASCYDGRVIFQTFSNHDYHYDEVLMLWENFITNTLSAHFAATR